MAARIFRTTFQRLVTYKRIAFERYLLATNTAICISLSATGDFLQQQYNIIRHNGKYDPFRTMRYCATGFTIGPICHYYYQVLDKIIPSRKGFAIVKKVLVDQLVFSPVIITTFFFTMGLMERHTIAKIKRDLFKKGSQLYTAEWMIWPPAQCINFYLLPVRYRVLYDNTISVGFDCYLSYIKHKVDDDDDENDEPPIIR